MLISIRSESTEVAYGAIAEKEAATDVHSIATPPMAHTKGFESPALNAIRL